MSAFVVNEITMHKVVAAIIGLAQRNYLTFDGKVLSVSQTSEIKHAGNVVGRALYRMNCAAVNARYAYSEDENYGQDYKFDINYEVMKKDYRGAMLTVDHMKSVGCLIYQCSEGDVPKTDIFKELQKVEGDIALMIVKRMPEYDAAS